MCPILLFLLLLGIGNCQESAQYLQNAVRDLRRLNYRQILRRADTIMATQNIPQQEVAQSISRQEVPVKAMDRRAQPGPEVVPTLSLTKGELAALYENAIAKGDTLKLDAGDNTYVHAAVHELNPRHPYPTSHSYQEHPSSDKYKQEDGYYYYYYPIKSFLDEMSGSNVHEIKKPWTTSWPSTTRASPYQYHSHHHEVTIKKDEVEEKKDRQGILEPIYMALSGFVGMAAMFVITMIILPKLQLKPKKSAFWKNSDLDMDELARLALNAIEGKDCRERFACELSKITAARNFNLADNRFIKLFERIAPGTFGSQIERIGKYGDRQLECTLIPCTRTVKVQKIIKKSTKKKDAAQKKH